MGCKSFSAVTHPIAYDRKEERKGYEQQQQPG